MLGEVGRGGMGVVYAARDLKLKREVAIKTLLPKYRGCADAAGRFEREAEVTGQLQHPGVPAVHQIGTLPDVSCLAAIFSASDRKTGGGRVI